MIVKKRLIRPALPAACVFPARLVNRLVHFELSAVKILAVCAGDCRLGFLVVAHFNKAEAFGVAGFPVADDLYRFNGPKTAEEVAEGFLPGFVGKISHIQFLSHNVLVSGSPLRGLRKKFSSGNQFSSFSSMTSPSGKVKLSRCPTAAGTIQFTPAQTNFAVVWIRQEKERLREKTGPGQFLYSRNEPLRIGNANMIPPPLGPLGRGGSF